MRGHADVVARRDSDGRTSVVRCGGTPPLTPRLTSAPGARGAVVHLTATAGGPLPGDEADLGVHVGGGASLTVRAVAATVALPGPDPALPSSRWTVRAQVEAGGTLVVLAEPLVAAHGCRHVTSASIELVGDARLVWNDMIVAGRSGESPGDATMHLHAARDGCPLLAQSISVGPAAHGWQGPASLGGARCAGTLLVAGPPAWRPASAVRLGDSAVLLPLAAEGAALGTALGDAPDVRAALRAWLPGSPGWVCPADSPRPVSSGASR